MEHNTEGCATSSRPSMLTDWEILVLLPGASISDPLLRLLCVSLTQSPSHQHTQSPGHPVIQSLPFNSLLSINYKFCFPCSPLSPFHVTLFVQGSLNVFTPQWLILLLPTISPLISLQDSSCTRRLPPMVSICPYYLLFNAYWMCLPDSPMPNVLLALWTKFSPHIFILYVHVHCCPTTLSHPPLAAPSYA